MKRINFLVTTFIFLASISSNSYSALMEYTFTSLDETAIGGQALPSLGSTLNTYAITNETGSTWTDFHLDSIFGGFTLGSYSGLGTIVFSGNVIDTLGTQWSETIDIFDLNIASGETLNFSVSTFCAGEACGLGTVYTAHPTVDGNISAPEPSVILLFGSGILGLMGLSTRRKT